MSNFPTIDSVLAQVGFLDYWRTQIKKSCRNYTMRSSLWYGEFYNQK